MKAKRKAPSKPARPDVIRVQRPEHNAGEQTSAASPQKVQAPEPTVAPDEVKLIKWWKKPEYTLQSRAVFRKVTNELVAFVVLVKRAGDELPAAVLSIVPTSDQVDAARADLIAGRIASGEDLNDEEIARLNRMFPSVIDWTDTPEPAPGDRLDDAFWNLLNQVRTCKEMIAAALPAESRLRTIFEAVTPDWDAEEIPRSALRRALSCFESLEDPKKRMLLQGWAPDAFEKLSRDEIPRDTLIPVLACHGPALDGGIGWSFETVQDGTPYPVRLLIQAGTCKAMALCALDQFRDDIVQNWAILISHPDEVVRPQKVVQS